MNEAAEQLSENMLFSIAESTHFNFRICRLLFSTQKSSHKWAIAVSSCSLIILRWQCIVWSTQGASETLNNGMEWAFHEHLCGESPEFLARTLFDFNKPAFVSSPPSFRRVRFLQTASLLEHEKRCRCRGCMSSPIYRACTGYEKRPERFLLGNESWNYRLVGWKKRMNGRSDFLIARKCVTNRPHYLLVFTNNSVFCVAYDKDEIDAGMLIFRKQIIEHAI